MITDYRNAAGRQALQNELDGLVKDFLPHVNDIMFFWVNLIKDMMKSKVQKQYFIELAQEAAKATKEFLHDEDFRMAVKEIMYALMDIDYDVYCSSRQFSLDELKHRSAENLAKDLVYCDTESRLSADESILNYKINTNIGKERDPKKIKAIIDTFRPQIDELAKRRKNYKAFTKAEN